MLLKLCKFTFPSVHLLGLHSDCFFKLLYREQKLTALYCANYVQK